MWGGQHERRQVRKVRVPPLPEANLCSASQGFLDLASIKYLHGTEGRERAGPLVTTLGFLAPPFHPPSPSFPPSLLSFHSPVRLSRCNSAAKKNLSHLCDTLAIIVVGVM
eukprot:EG_transcript_37347